jgi:hypothetical protein
MSKTRAVFGLVVIIGLFVISAAPASAWMQSLNKGTTGKGSAGQTTFTNEGATIRCEKVEGEWQIRTSGKITERVKGPGQQLTKEGPHEDIVIKTANQCTAFGFAGAELKPCVYQAEQPEKGGGVATWSQVSECVVVAKGNCEVKLVAEAANEHLKTITLENSGTNDKLLAKVTGITTVATSLGGLGCVGIKNLKNATGTASIPWVPEEQNFV